MGGPRLRAGVRKGAGYRWMGSAQFFSSLTQVRGGVPSTGMSGCGLAPPPPKAPEALKGRLRCQSRGARGALKASGAQKWG